MNVALREIREGTVLPVRATPGAKRNAIIGVHAGALKVTVTQAAEQGKANQAVIELLAKGLGLSKSRITLHAGATSRSKQFLLHNTTRADVAKLLSRVIG